MPSVYPTTYSGEASLLGAAVRALTAGDFRSAAPRVLMFANENIGTVANVNAVALSHVAPNVALRALAGLALRTLSLAGLAYTAWELYDYYRTWRRSADGYQLGVPYPEVLAVYPPSWDNRGGLWKQYPPDYYCEKCSVPNHFLWIGDPAVGCNYAPWQWLKSQFDLWNSNWPGAQMMFPGVWSTNSMYVTDPYFDGGIQYVDITLDRGFTTAGYLGSDYQSSDDIPPLPQRWPIDRPFAVRRVSVAPGTSAPLIHTLDPASMPVGYYAFTPTPFPWALIPLLGVNPYRIYQRESGYDLYPDLRCRRGSLPQTAPTLEIATSPSVLDRSPPLTADHVLRRNRGKERKVRVRGLLATMNLFGKATEISDVVDCLYNALPSFVRRRKRSLPNKIRAIYENFDRLDLPLAVKNLVYNELEDRLYGAMGSFSKSASQGGAAHGRLPIGWGFGPAL